MTNHFFPPEVLKKVSQWGKWLQHLVSGRERGGINLENVDVHSLVHISNFLVDVPAEILRFQRQVADLRRIIELDDQINKAQGWDAGLAARYEHRDSLAAKHGLPIRRKVGGKPLRD